MNANTAMFDDESDDESNDDFVFIVEDKRRILPVKYHNVDLLAKIGDKEA